MLGYQFFHDYCGNHEGSVQFIDDDTFVRFDIMEELMEDPAGIYCLKGFPIDNYAVSYVGKYYVWVDQWPSSYRVPKYCNGQCVAMNAESARRLYKAAANTNRHDFRLEDMFFTGILRRKANLQDPSGIESTSWGQENEGLAACLHTKAQSYEEMDKVIKKFEIGRLEMRYEH